MFAALLITTLSAPNLITNPGFDEGVEGWISHTALIPAAAEEFQDRTCAVVAVGDNADIAYYRLSQQVAAVPGGYYEAQFDGYGEGVRDGYGVYAAIEYVAADGNRIGYAQSDPVSLDGAWRRVSVRGLAPADAASIRLVLLLHGRGTARFDNVVLTVSDTDPLDPGPLDEPVTLTVAATPLARPLLGIGAEDDGWAYNAENASHGVTEADYALREERIAWMDPDLVRMFVWYKDWCPSGDWAKYTFDSDNMRSHYRTLDLYQRIGAAVALCGVEWGMPDVFEDPPALARAWGDLVEHLVRVRGYTCIRYWTLTNEPNSFWFRKYMSFDRYVQIHELVAKEFGSRNLPIQIMGSDDTAGLEWFAACANEPRYRSITDIFVSHRYFQFLDQYMAPTFLDDRLGLAGEMPFAVMEFGFIDERSSALINPLMEDYPYALWALDFAVDALNRGAVALSIWCMHEMYYPGNGFMNFGLWDFKDNDWRPRPVYHAWAALTRRTEPGELMYPVTSSHPGHVKAVRVGKTLFWINHASVASTAGLTDGSSPGVFVRIEGWTPTHVRIFTEASLSGDRLGGTLVESRDNSFMAPAQSFGYAFTGEDTSDP